MSVFANPLSTCVPGQARPVTAADESNSVFRARAGIFTSQLWVKTPDLRAMLRKALRPGTRVLGGAMMMAARNPSACVPGSRVALTCRRPARGTRVAGTKKCNRAAIRDHVPSASCSYPERRDPGSSRRTLHAAARLGTHADGWPRSGQIAGMTAREARAMSSSCHSGPLAQDPFVRAFGRRKAVYLPQWRSSLSAVSVCSPMDPRDKPWYDNCGRSSTRTASTPDGNALCGLHQIGRVLRISTCP